MKLKYIILIALCILLIVILLFSIIRGIIVNQNIKETEISSTPALTPTLIAGANNEPLQILQIQPLPDASNVALDSNINLTFNKAVTIQDIFVEIVPKTSFTLVSNGAIVTVQLNENLQPGLLYAVNIGKKEPDSISFFFQSNFRAIGPTPSPVQYDSPNVIESDLEFARLNDPDLYLVNQVPYTGRNFSIKSIPFLDDKGAANYRFEVAVNQNASRETAEAELNTWLTSLKITTELRQQLSITWVD